MPKADWKQASWLSNIAIGAYVLILPDQAANFFEWLRPTLTKTFDAFFLLSAKVFVLFCLFLILPSLVCMFWMAAFGGRLTKFSVTRWRASSKSRSSTTTTRRSRCSQCLRDYRFRRSRSVIGSVLVIVFFVPSSDAGSLVIGTITAGGKVDAPVPQRVFWASFEGLVAMALLVGGSLSSLQAMVILTGLLFTVVLLVMCYAIFKGLQSEKRHIG